MPETEATLRQQQAALMDPTNDREAMVYPLGMKPFDITANKWRYGTTKLPDGRVVQYDTRGPRALTKAKIADLAKPDAEGNDKINELLQLGPVSQAEAVKQSVAGVGDPAVVTERAPPTVPGEPGVERKAAEGTTATAPAQVEALEATKTPGSTVQVETHEQAMAPRLKPEGEPAPIGAAEPTPGVEPTKIGETKYLSVWDNGDGTYFKRYADGRPDEPIPETIAKMLTAQEAYKPQVSEAEKIRQAAQASAPPPVRKILPDVSEEGQRRAAEQAAADAEAAARVAAEAGAPPKIKPVKPPEEVKGAKKGKPADEKVKRINAIADEVVKNHPMLSDQEKLAAIDPTREGGKGARLKALAYVKELLDKAQAAGFEFKDRFMDRKDEELQHSNAASVLYEAKLLRDAKEKDFGRFFHHEHELRTKGREAYRDLLKQRFESGKEWANKANKPTGEAKAVEDVEKAAAPTAPREGVSIGAVSEKPDVHAEMEAAKERVAEEDVAKSPGEERKETALQRQAREASERARAKLEEQEKAAPRERPTQESKSESAGEDKHWKDMLSEAHKEKAEGDVTIGEAGRYVSLDHAVNVARAAIEDGTIKPWQAHLINSLGIWPKDVGRVLAEIKGEEAEAPRAAVGFKVEARGRAKLDALRVKINEAKKPELKDEEDALPPESADHKTGDDNAPADGYLRYRTGSEKGDYVDLKTSRPSTTIGAAIHEHLNLNKYAPWLSKMVEKLRDAVVDIAGDTPVHYVSHAELRDKLGHSYRGVYRSQLNEPYIVINSDKMSHDTALHEGFHAATLRGIIENPKLASALAGIRDTLEKYTRDHPVLVNNLNVDDQVRLQAALKDKRGIEMMTYLMTNEGIQKLFKIAKVSETEAKSLDIAGWRKKTMWEGAMSLMRQGINSMLGREALGPRDIPAIEAMMAATEQAMWAHPRGEKQLFEAAERLSKNQLKETFGDLEDAHDEDQKAFMRSPKESLARVKDIDKGMVKQFTKDKLTNLGGSVMRGSAKIMSGTWLNEMHGDLFRDAKGKILEAINDTRNKVSHKYSQLMTKDVNHINRGYMLDRTHASQMADYSKLMDMSVRYNIHANEDASKPSKARKDWQRDEFGPEARSIFARLHPDLQKRYIDDINYAVDKQGDMSRNVVDTTLPLFEPPKGSTLEEVMNRARDNKMTDDDWAHYEDLGVAGPLQEAYRLAGKKDVFANSQRDGRWVVNGHYPMPKGGKDISYSGSELPDNVREFDNEQQARVYATGTRMKATTREAYYIKDASGKYTDVYPKTPETEAAGIVGKRVKAEDAETTKYRVSLERQNYQAATSRAEAMRNREAMAADGVENLSGVMDKRDEKAWSQLNSADQNLLERRIDSRKDLTDDEKQHMKDVTRQMMLASRGGMSSHLIQARKVAGARFDTAAGLHAYARAANFHIARQAHAAELSDAMSRMDAHEKAMRATDPDNATQRSIVANEYRDRVFGANASTLPSSSSPLMHKIMTWAFINFLARPSHILLSQIHPYIYSVPMLAARHGYWKSLQGQRQAMRDLGGMGSNLLAGAKAGYDVYKSGNEQNIDKAVAMARGVDPILRMINGLKDKGERDALMHMWETEHLHSAFDASVFSGAGIDRTNAIVRQFTDAMEANNRLSTALNAYRLEKAMHKDPANALAYSRRIIEQTHGVFSPTNAATVFKNPIIRPIMQFRQQPMNLAIMMYRNIAKSLPEKLGGDADNEARWTLAYQLGTAAALGGMGGMPMDLPKLAGLAGQAVGGPSPSDWDDKFYRTLVEYLGKNGADLIHDGLPGIMGPYGPSLGHRTGFDAGFLFGEPKSDSPDDIFNYTAKSLAGASVGMGLDWMNALHNAEQGNWERAGEYLMPGSLKDMFKTYRNATEGSMAGKQQVAPASFGDEVLQMLGFSGVQREQQMAGHFAFQKRIKADQAAQAATKGAQLKAKHQGRTTLGVRVSRGEEATAREYEDAYQ